MIDFTNLDERATGMFWVLSFTMVQPACEAVMNWFTSAGMADLIQGPNMQPSERIMMMRETYPLSMPLLSGLSINLCMKLAFQLEETIFLGQVETPNRTTAKTKFIPSLYLFFNPCHPFSIHLDLSNMHLFRYLQPGHDINMTAISHNYIVLNY